MRLYLGTLLLLCFLAALGISAQPAEGYIYGYVIREGDIYTLHLIDPQNPEIPVDTSVIPTPEGFGLVQIQASPDGNWIVLVWSRSDFEELIQLMDMQTGQLHDIASLNLTVVPTWSPDSQYFAYTGVPLGQSNSEILTTFAYSFGNQQLIHIKDSIDVIPTVRQYDQFWSPTSTQLLIANHRCVNAECDQRLEVFSLPSATLSRSIDITIVGNVDAICPLSWSPDERYIHFQENCDAISEEIFSEVFRWDLSDSSLTQVTHFTNSPDPAVPATDIFGSEYSAVWADSQTMLLGLAVGKIELGVGILPSSATYGTFAYSPPSFVATSIAAEAGFDWVRNLISGELAYRSKIYTTGTYGELAVQNETIEIALFDGQQLNTIISSPNGCNLNWSPDGTFLAYSYHGTPHFSCYGSVSGFYFINPVTRELNQLLVNERSNVMPVGWVKMGSAAWPPPTHRIFLTNTPLPTPAITPTVIAYAG